VAVLRTYLAILILVVSCARAHADQKDSSLVMAAIKKSYPDIVMDAVSKTDIDGLFEVVSDGRIFYYHLKTGSLITGEIIREGRNLTAARRDAATAAMVQTIPLEKAVKVGSGKATVIEFSDPDCPYCRQADAFLAKRDDITLYVFLFPLPMHKDAGKKSLQILCSADRAVALRQAMAGGLDKAFSLSDGCDARASSGLKESMAWGKKLGVMGTPAFWINGQRVDGMDIPRIEKLLADGQKEKKGK
jgi:thiol:disulfide interchange protein DsbC